MNVQEFTRRFAAMTRNGADLLTEEQMADFLAPIYERFRRQAPTDQAAGCQFWKVAKRVIPGTYDINAIRLRMTRLRFVSNHYRAANADDDNGIDEGDQGAANVAAEGLGQAARNVHANNDNTNNNDAVATTAVGPRIVAVTRRVADAIRDVQGPLNEDQELYLFSPLFEMVRHYTGSDEAASLQMRNIVLRIELNRLRLAGRRTGNGIVEGDDTMDDDVETTNNDDGTNGDTNVNQDSTNNSDGGDDVMHEEDSEGEDFRTANVIRRRSLPLNRRRRTGNVIFDDEDTEDVDDDDANERVEMQEEEEDLEAEDPRIATENHYSTRNSSANVTVSRPALQAIQPLGDVNVRSIPNHSPLHVSVVAPSLRSRLRSSAPVPAGAGTVPKQRGTSLNSKCISFKCAPSNLFLRYSSIPNDSVGSGLATREHTSYTTKLASRPPCRQH
jgi:hypothetical protein